MKSLKNKIILSLIVFICVVGVLLLKKSGIDLNNIARDVTQDKISDVPVSDKMSVHFLDVGKADSILIKCKDKNILIDAADKDVNNKVVDYLKKNHVNKLDLVVVTHPHRDHIGQMTDVINNFQINKFVMPKLKDGVMSVTKTYENMLKALSTKKISAEEPSINTPFDVGNMKIRFVAPNNKYDDINNYSVVTHVTYGKTKFIFMGDAEKGSESDILKKGFDVKADVIKIGHHGSKTSTSQDFLNAVKPKYAVISVGPDKNNLPKKETLNRLTSNKINVVRTDISGNLVFLTDGDKIEIYKEREE